MSSNFGNSLSMLAASALLPFLPMLPLQVLAQNLCFDLSQLALAFDRVDEPPLRRPRTFDLARFVICLGGYCAATLAAKARYLRAHSPWL